VAGAREYSIYRRPASFKERESTGGGIFKCPGSGGGAGERMKGLVPLVLVLGMLLAAGLPAEASAVEIGAKTPGPFAGAVRQGQTATHAFSNYPPGGACPAWFQPVIYTVQLRYAPSTDVLTISAAGKTATGANGAAQVSFMRNYCTEFTVAVTGISVAQAAAYVVDVQRGPPTA
jgi:hypothetical protein